MVHIVLPLSRQQWILLFLVSNIKTASFNALKGKLRYSSRAVSSLPGTQPETNTCTLLAWMNLHSSLHIHDVTRCRIQRVSEDNVSGSWWFMRLLKPSPGGQFLHLHVHVLVLCRQKSWNETNLRVRRLGIGKLNPDQHVWVSPQLWKKKSRSSFIHYF